MPVVSSLLHLFAKPRLYTQLGMVSDEARSHRQFTLLFLFLLLLLLSCSSELACGYDVCFFHMPLGQHDACLMIDQTDGMHWIAMLLFKLQSPPLRFSINSHRICSSLLLLFLQDVQNNTAKGCF